MPDGSVIALEVTQDMAQARENQRGALENLRWKFDQLGREWFVDLLDNAWVNDLHTRLPELLGQLERKGITELKVPRVAGGDDERTDAGTVGEFRDLGVLSCRSYESGDDSVGAVHTDQIVDAVWGDVNSATAVVARHVSERQDNACKLARAASAAERHLLIWVDQAVLAANAAMQVGERQGLLPSEVPELPPEIDVVWLALAMADPIVWRLDSAGWESRGRVDEAVHLEHCALG
ncbi:hypothetical protein [Candidatus Poriferisodalis sp.]|uniref:hypothetical protein n=1 Tax=Candidatus Poriferisodalis sp. TaxID=3101277 RepID=UPI003B02C2FF